jgi:protein phosphatase
MEKLAEVCKASDGLLLATSYRQVDVTDTASVEEATQWWEELTGRGGEGMVVKPLDFIVRGRRGLTQPAVKCRGPEYLRIIYGPEYLLPENLERLRSRSVSTKRSLALREFALGIEATRAIRSAGTAASSVSLPSKASRSILACSFSSFLSPYNCCL